MKGLYLLFQRSIAIKVVTSTLLLSLGVIWLTGSALNSRLSDGIRSVNLNSSLAEARLALFNAQYQFVITQVATPEQRETVLAQIVKEATTQGAKQLQREVIIIKSPTNKIESESFEIASNQSRKDSVPPALRENVVKSAEIAYEYGTLTYDSEISFDSLFIGSLINIPSAGQYEMYVVFSLADQASTITLIQNSLLVTGFALIFLIALITWLVVRQVVRPVRQAASVAKQFTQGEFDLRLPIDSKDELATLAISFNDMAESIEQQISRLENLSRVQQRFVSDVTHELRTPLTTLRMASEVIHNNRESFDPPVARSAELLVAQLDRFERLLEDLLEVSRFDAEVAILEPIEFDLISLIKRCVEDLGVNGDEKTSGVSIKSDNATVTIKADMRRVERIMRNLLSNALDHCEGTPIEIQIRSTDSEVAVGVRDFGSGLDESSLIRVFDRFWRADPSRARVRGGTGLGLSIALEDARLHNGELDAWGRPGKGAHFVLTLPRIAGTHILSRPLKPTPEDFHEEYFYQ
ncbi:MAG: HAMP domain-containing protein [Actinobacteria bacterium]|uniref:Sensor histidine kinase MtrB n=1 Tax=freshwater metagenome TaxID=449393 RepID=A0A6J6HRA7_9ZZZZ|nr:HAMP domain-containing protein [Actinomycetota bacterium]MTA20693.1 HAMP domain-containing protein [Actinomycetota bacterium]